MEIQTPVKTVIALIYQYQIHYKRKKNQVNVDMPWSQYFILDTRNCLITTIFFTHPVFYIYLCRIHLLKIHSSKLKIDSQFTNGLEYINNQQEIIWDLPKMKSCFHYCFFWQKTFQSKIIFVRPLKIILVINKY